MKYRKIKADQIFDGYKLLTGHVLIVAENGRIENLLTIENAGSEIEELTGILSPGFINCHCHLELSHMKGLIPERTGLVDFVFKVVTERHFSEEEILSAIRNAEDEMLSNGIVAVGDICNNTLTISQKQKRRIAYYNFIEASGWHPSVANIRFGRSKKIWENFEHISKDTPIGNLYFSSTNSIVPHAPYSVSEQLWQLIQPYFENKVVSIHNQETAYEDEFFLEGKGDFQRMYEMMKIDNTHHQPSKRSSLQTYFEKLENASSAILVHNSFIKQEDIDHVKKFAGGFQESNSRSNNSHTNTNQKLQTFFCLCPNANLYIENVLPPVELLRKNDCRIVLGTDSLASNKGLSILDEMKTIRKNFPAISLVETLNWVTINGAKALQMEKTLGSFEKGKQPGVNLIDEDLKSVKKLF